MNLVMFGSLIGGLGLFLLGMHLMTEGLKLAAGRTLSTILHRVTDNPLQGLLSGALITALVQSSSAVTIATIGFVNAGVLSLRRSITVIFGSNVGTTMTGWLVALIGLHLDIKAFALPFIGLGMLMQLLGKDRQYGSFGLALAGFGLFFVGIDVLKVTFSGLETQISLDAQTEANVMTLLQFVGGGFLLTVLTQSSSAAIAIILTASAGNVLPLEMAAAAVIGSNLGTTSTAGLAVIGATSNAKRVAAAHVLFNLITGVVGLLILPLLLNNVVGLVDLFGLEHSRATLLALFHTTFNVLGVLLTWPFSRRLVTLLQSLFRTAEENEAQPRHLDHTLLGTPHLAIHALGKELARTGSISKRMVMGAISSESDTGKSLKSDQWVLKRLTEDSTRFARQLQKSSLSPELSEIIPEALRITRYQTEIADLAKELAHNQNGLTPLSLAELADESARFRSDTIGLAELSDVSSKHYSLKESSDRLALLEENYQRLKGSFLRAGSRGDLPVREMVKHLDQFSTIRRIAQQMEKSTRYWAHLTSYIDPQEEEEEEGNYSA